MFYCGRAFFGFLSLNRFLGFLLLLIILGKGENKLGKLLERVRADALAGKDTDVWCSMRFQLATPLDVAVDFAVTKGGEVVAEPSFEGKPIVRMGETNNVK